MYIIEHRSFKYPSDLATQWRDEVFQPQIDHRFKLELTDGKKIEAGVFELLVDGTSEIHACISTQAGCKLGCKMCSSGRSGFSRNLTQTEIVSEIIQLSTAVGTKVFDHVVYMGIGEPLDNYDNFVGSVVEIVSRVPDYAGRLSFATVGIPDKLRRLQHEDIPPFRMLWVSLHAVTNEQRSELMPINQAFNVLTVIEAAKEYARNCSTEVWINYMLFRGFNDTAVDAGLLAELLEGTEGLLSIMLTEPNNDFSTYRAGNVSDLKRFEGYLIEAGIKNRIARFIAAGKQVRAGCGEFIYTA